MSRGNAVMQVAESLRERVLRQDRGTISRVRHLLQEERRKDRMRIATELHDTLLREFLGGSMRLCLAHDQPRADSPVEPILRRAVDLMRKGITKGRAALLGLRSPVLPDGSLEKAIADVRTDFAPSQRARFRLVIVGKRKPLQPAVQEQIFLIAREALLNALRHSEASSSEVEIEYLRRKLRVIVRDNGKGIDPRAWQSSQNSQRGLTGMRDRAARIGAEIRVWSNQGEGTEVEISVPILGV